MLDALNLMLTLIYLEMDGKTILFRARIHTIRRLSAKLVFVVFRQQTITIQGVLQVISDDEGIAGKSPGCPIHPA
jgi:ergosteryl-3beta-O-L-aspartate synthase